MINSDPRKFTFQTLLIVSGAVQPAKGATLDKVLQLVTSGMPSLLANLHVFVKKRQLIPCATYEIYEKGGVEILSGLIVKLIEQQLWKFYRYL